MNKLRLTLIATVLLSCALGSGCRLTMPAECKEFYALAPPQRETDFRAYPLEKQLDIYQCGMGRRHPPDQGLAWEIADGGEKIVPFLLDRLKAEKSEGDQENIIFIFQVMSRKGHLHGKRDVISQVKQVISAMNYSDVQARNQQRLEEIERNIAR